MSYILDVLPWSIPWFSRDLSQRYGRPMYPDVDVQPGGVPDTSTCLSSLYVNFSSVNFNMMDRNEEKTIGEKLHLEIVRVQMVGGIDGLMPGGFPDVLHS